MTYRTAIIVLTQFAFLAGPLSGCNSPPPEQPAAAQDPVAASVAKEPAAKEPATKEPVATAPTPKPTVPKTDCKALEKELMTYSNIHGKVIGFAWGQTLSKAKLPQKKVMAVFQSAQALQQKLSSDPKLTEKLGEVGLGVLVQAGCGPAGSPAPAQGDQRCEKIVQNLKTFKGLMNDLLDKGFKDALAQNKLGKRAAKLTKAFNKELPKAREKYKAEVQKAHDDLSKRTGCKID